jgi:hypothetical protein
MNILERKVEKRYGLNRGASIAGMVLGILVAIIMVYGAAIPVTTTVVAAANLTGMNAAMANLTITLLCLLPAIMVVQTIG